VGAGFARIFLASAGSKFQTGIRNAPRINDVHETMRKFHVYPRAAAYILAVGRVADATLVRGLFP